VRAAEAMVMDVKKVGEEVLKNIKIEIGRYIAKIVSNALKSILAMVNLGGIQDIADVLTTLSGAIFK